MVPTTLQTHGENLCCSTANQRSAECRHSYILRGWEICEQSLQIRKGTSFFSIVTAFEDRSINFYFHFHFQALTKDGDKEWDGMSLFRFFIPKDSSLKTHDHLHLLSIRDDIYVIFLVVSLIGGIRYPFAVAIGGFLWNLSYIHLKWNASTSSKEIRKPKFEGIATKCLSIGLLIPFLATFAFSIYLTGYVKDTDTTKVVENWQRVGRWNK